jgi:hypothetical protein
MYRLGGHVLRWSTRYSGARTFEDNYVEFSVFMGVVTCIVVVMFSFVKPKPNS